MSNLDYPLTLALQNYMPVLLPTLGLMWIAQGIARIDRAVGRLAWVGVALIFAGGLLKANWKLVMSLSRVDVPLFRQALFPLLAPGFTFVAWSVWLMRQKSAISKRRIWLPPLLVAGVVGLASLSLAIALPSRVWAFVLIGLVTGASTVLAIALATQARQQHLNLAAILFIVNLLVNFGLSGIAAMPQRTLAVEWTEQIISTISGAAFAAAAWMLTQLHASRTSQRVIFNLNKT
jgi:hypothetical protein